MTHQAIDSLYQRFQALIGEIDEKGEKLHSWQSTALHTLASEAESVLAGCRRQKERRG